MTKQLSAFSPVVGLTGVCSAQKATLRCTAIELNAGMVCLYSPVLGLKQAARASVDALGEVSHLLAPNHYHHKGLNEYAKAFPNARLCCSPGARPRLEKQTGLRFVGFEDVAAELPATCSLLLPLGLKTGETWLQVEQGSERAWIVTDAFRGPDGPPGFVSDQVELLGPFPKFGIADRAVYHTWLSARIGDAPPTMIVPCHGSVVHGPNIASDALKLVSDLLP